MNTKEWEDEGGMNNAEKYEGKASRQRGCLSTISSVTSSKLRTMQNLVGHLQSRYFYIAKNSEED